MAIALRISKGNMKMHRNHKFYIRNTTLLGFFRRPNIFQIIRIRRTELNGVWFHLKIYK